MARILLIIWLAALASPARAADLAAAGQGTTLEEVLRSSLEHYPRILAAQSELRSREALAFSAEGAFDPRIDVSLEDRLSGYYDGQSLSTEVLQPLQPFNARVFAGYRRGEGSFPSYQGSRLTQDDGEARVGVTLSLLRDRVIDERRARVRESLLDVVAGAQELSAEKLVVLRDAYVVYAQWLLSARLLEAYDSLLQIARERGAALSDRVVSGDAAEILLVENRQAELQREALVVDAKRQLDMSAEQLALFLRDENGAPRYPVYEPGLQMPPEDAELLAADVDAMARAVLDLRPEVGLLEAARRQAELKESLALNSRKPKLDLSLYSSRDFGGGPLSLAGTENVADLSFSFPLRTREADGKAAAARAEIDRIEHSLRLTREQLRTGLRRALLNLDATREMERLAIAELEASATLAAAENQRFDAGLSDFFLLNVRERQIGEAQLKRWQAHLAHQAALADFYAATMRLEQLAAFR